MHAPRTAANAVSPATPTSLTEFGLPFFTNSSAISKTEKDSFATSKGISIACLFAVKIALCLVDFSSSVFAGSRLAAITSLNA